MLLTRESRSILILACDCALIGCCAVLMGCSTHSQRLVGPRHAFYANDLFQAEAQLTKLAAKPKGDENVIAMDLAMVDLLQGNAASAEQRLRTVRDNLDHLEQKSLAG